jgi:hypothetical protein
MPGHRFPTGVVAKPMPAEEVGGTYSDSKGVTFLLSRGDKRVWAVGSLTATQSDTRGTILEGGKLKSYSVRVQMDLLDASNRTLIAAISKSVQMFGIGPEYALKASKDKGRMFQDEIAAGLAKAFP